MKYIRDKTRTLRRRFQSRLWQTFYWFNMREAEEHQSLPPELWNVREAFVLASKNYKPQSYDGHVTLFRAQDRPFEQSPDAQGGWQALAIQGVEIHSIPGDHVTILHEPHVRILAEALKSCIASASNR